MPKVCITWLYPVTNSEDINWTAEINVLCVQWNSLPSALCENGQLETKDTSFWTLSVQNTIQSCCH